MSIRDRLLPACCRFSRTTLKLLAYLGARLHNAIPDPEWHVVQVKGPLLVSRIETERAREYEQ